MAEPLNVLVIEDTADDAELLVRQLRRAGFDVKFQRVESATQLAAALSSGPFDVVISDYVLPGFSCAEAIRMVRKADPEVPFLVLSGTQGEETAVEVMRAGAHDYLVKQNLHRLGPAVQRELKEAQGRKDKKKLEQQLIQAQKLEAIGTLAGGVAHDFNNVLSGILGNAELARDELKDHAASPYLEHIVAAGRRAQDLVRQILSFSRHSEPRRENVQLGSVIQEALKLLRVTIPRQIELAAELPPEMPAVFADPGQVHQVLMNLCTNAAHAIGHAPGRIVARLTDEAAPQGLAHTRPPLPQGRYVRLSVSDTGAGMDPQTLARIFEPFFTTKAPGQGTGLGLQVVDNIVRTHHAGLKVESTKGAGTTFHVYFPVRAGQADAPSTLLEDAPPRGKGERLLLVDDEETVLWVAQRMLVRLGYTVTCFPDAADALTAFTREPQKFDALVTDLALPRMSGTELVRALHQVRPGLPFAITTGNPTDAETTRALDLGAKVLIEKPYTSATLARAIQRTLTPG
ncbi:MAG: response regulator [Deltaproteobacteria bacterium]|nr:response regulator [Deltaproteobacteria bacterium]